MEPLLTQSLSLEHLDGWLAFFDGRWTVYGHTGLDAMGLAGRRVWLRRRPALTPPGA